jgi:hypothetical protein
MKVSRLWADYKMRHPEEIRQREQWSGNGNFRQK